VQIFTKTPKQLDWGSPHSNFHARPKNDHLMVVLGFSVVALGFPVDIFAFPIQ
jgi:hypothetical protein